MKKLYYVECDSEYDANGLVSRLNELGYWGWYETRKSAHEAMVMCKNEAKKNLAEEIAIERKYGNTITVDLWVCEVKDDFDTEVYSIWAVENRQLLECRYLCGRY